MYLRKNAHTYSTNNKKQIRPSRGSNPGRSGLKPDALPTELPGRFLIIEENLI